ncbi:MAG TPA: glycosyltransferase family 39 protein [Acidimicrobiia bacterium]
MKLASDAPSRAPGTGADAASPRRNGWITAGVVAALAAGVALRLYTRSDLWLDEALTVNVAELPLGDLEEALRHDGAPPLYYVLLHLWMEVFGSGDEAVRLLSAVFSIATLPVAWFVGRRVGGPAVAWAFVLLLASSPYAIRYATENRPYALQMLLVVSGWLLLCRALDRPSLGRLAPLAVVVGLLLYTQYWSMYLLGVVGVCLLWRSVKAHAPADRQAARSAVVAIVAGSLTFLPWVPTFLYQAEHTGTPWGEPILPASGFAFTSIDFAGGAKHSEAFVLLVPLLLLALLAIFGRATGGHTVELDLRTRPGVRLVASVLVVSLLIGLVASYAAGTTFTGRYAAVVFPLFALVAAFGFTVFADPRLRIGALALVVVIGFVGGVRNLVEQRTQAEESAEIIRAEARPGDVVLYCPDQIGPAVTRLLEGEPGLEQLTFPDGAPPEFVDWVDYEERIDAVDPAQFAQEVLELAGPDHTIWYVQSPGYRNFEGECETLGAALSAGRPGAVPRVAPDDEIFEFQGLVEYPAP